MTTPLASFSGPTDSAVLPCLSLKPEAGVVSETDAGFTDVLEFCATPVVAGPVVEMDPLVAAVMSPTISPRSWRLDPVEAEPVSSDHDDDHGEMRADDFSVVAEPAQTDEVPAEVLAIAVNPPLLAIPAVPADLPTDSPWRAGSAFAESSQRDTAGNGVTNFPLHHQAVAEAEAPAEFASEADALVDPADAPEKFAVAIRAPLERVNAVAETRPENKFLNHEEQADANSVKARGTGRAKPPADMPATLDPIPGQTAFTPLRAGGMNADAIPFVAPTTASSATPAIAFSPASTAVIGERREVYLPATDATAVVREVTELTHEFRLRERGSVEVKFDFQDATELSVRLAYRDGDVHATFRTDSDDLRAALGREWPGFSANIAREPGSPRIAEPVFSGSSDFADSSLGRDSGSAAGGDARDRWKADHSDRSGSPRYGFPAREFRPHAPALGLRFSSDRLLHAFA